MKSINEKRGGIVGDLVTGTGALVISAVVILVIVSTLLGANLLRSTATTVTATDTNKWINTTTYTLSGFDADNRNYLITRIVNSTDGHVILSGNWTFTDTTGVITNATTKTWSKVNITYTYIRPTTEEITTNSLSGNFTGGLDNVSTKLPTIFLIAIIVLLLGVLVLLIIQAKKNGLMGGTNGSL